MYKRDESKEEKIRIIQSLKKANFKRTDIK